VHHLFVHAAAAAITPERPHWQILVPEFTPRTEDLDALGFIRVDQEVVLHKDHLSALYLLIPVSASTRRIFLNRLDGILKTLLFRLIRRLQSHRFLAALNTPAADGCTEGDGLATRDNE
jgi:hypothetical protein